MSGKSLRLAYVPLTDAAPVIIAREMGFAASEGVALDLVQARSWALLRDFLSAGTVEAAHMLAPMAVARAMGLQASLPPVEVLMVLSHGGQVIGTSTALARDLPPLTGAAQAADAIRSAAGPRPRVGVPFAFSTHALLMGRWLGRGIEIRTVPPPLMAEALARGEIDLFCVGEPWGTVAAEAGVGAILASGHSIWAAPPEKVLAARAGWAESRPEAAGALMRAVWRAGRWLDQRGNREVAAEILARPEYLGLPVETLEASLTGRTAFALPPPPGPFITFHDGGASFPWRSTGALIGAQLAQRFDLPQEPAAHAGAAIFRTDLYRRHMRAAGADLPGASMKIEGTLTHPTAVASERGTMILAPDRFFDGWIFDPPVD